MCNRCCKNYKGYIFGEWYTCYNYKINDYEDKIYCEDCIIIKKNKKNLYFKISKREFNLN